MNPGNPYATPQAAVLEARAPDELIASLPVSVKWQARFRAIQRADGARMHDLKQLSAAERRAAFSLNILAFLFGPIYYACMACGKRH